MAGANSSWWNCRRTPRTMVWEVARARAPAFGVKSRSAMARSIRRRVSAEIDRLPESAYETVLRATPARLATSSMVAILAHLLIVEAVRFSYCERKHCRSSRLAGNVLACRPAHLQSRCVGRGVRAGCQEAGVGIARRRPGVRW